MELNVAAIHRGVFIKESGAGAAGVQELPLSERQLAILAFNPWLRLRTSQAMVDPGDSFHDPHLPPRLMPSATRPQR